MVFVGAGVAVLRAHQLGGFGDHRLACFDQRAHMLVTSLEGAGQDGDVFDIFVHHLVAQFANFKLGFRRFDPTQTLCTVQVVNGGPRFFSHRHQKLR